MHPNATYLLQTRLLQPDAYRNSVTDISIDYLQNQGIRALLLDVDDTLVAKHDTQAQPSAALRAWLEAVQEAGITVILFSNGRRTRVQPWAQSLGILGFALVGKPFPLLYHRMLKRVNLPAHHIAMIGDQLFTDVLGANIVGMHSIWVDALSQGSGGTRVLRHIEAPLRKHYRGL